MTQATDPVCYRHPSRVTYLRCSRCNRPICPDCMHEAAVGQHCPECVAAARRGSRQARTVFGGTLAGQHGHVTKTLIGLNIAVAVVVIATAGGAIGSALLGALTPGLLWGAMQTGPFAAVEIVGDQLRIAPGGVAEGEYHRLLTSMFLHFGIFHLLVNMWAIWVVGGALEPMLGRIRFLALYLVSGLGGSVATYLFVAPLVPGGGATISAGASGAVFGLFAAFYVLMRRLGRDTSMITMILIINLVLTFVIPFISIWGHLGGLVTGGVLAIGLAYAPRQTRTVVQVAAVIGVVVLLGALTLMRTAALA